MRAAACLRASASTKQKLWRASERRAGLSSEAWRVGSAARGGTVSPAPGEAGSARQDRASVSRQAATTRQATGGRGWALVVARLAVHCCYCHCHCHHYVPVDSPRPRRRATTTTQPAPGCFSAGARPRSWPHTAAPPPRPPIPRRPWAGQQVQVVSRPRPARCSPAARPLITRCTPSPDITAQQQVFLRVVRRRGRLPGGCVPRVLLTYPYYRGATAP